MCWLLLGLRSVAYYLNKWWALFKMLAIWIVSLTFYSLHSCVWQHLCIFWVFFLACLYLQSCTKMCVFKILGVNVWKRRQSGLRSHNVLGRGILLKLVCLACRLYILLTRLHTSGIILERHIWNALPHEGMNMLFLTYLFWKVFPLPALMVLIAVCGNETLFSIVSLQIVISPVFKVALGN